MKLSEQRCGIFDEIGMGHQAVIGSFEEFLPAQTVECDQNDILICVLSFA